MLTPLQRLKYIVLTRYKMVGQQIKWMQCDEQLVLQVNSSLLIYIYIYMNYYFEVG